MQDHYLIEAAIQVAFKADADGFKETSVAFRELAKSLRVSKKDVVLPQSK